MRGTAMSGRNLNNQFDGPSLRCGPSYELGSRPRGRRREGTREGNYRQSGRDLFGDSSPKSGAVCAVYATRRENEFIDVDTKVLAEKRCIETGLGAFEVLSMMDEASGDSGSWSPSMGL